MGAEAIRDERIVSLMPLVRRLARRVARGNRTVEYEDLVSEGTVGAIQAVDRWDEGRDVALAAFAGRRILGQMYDSIRDYSPLSRGHWKQVLDGEEHFYLSSLHTPVHDDNGNITLAELLPDNEDTIAKMVDALAVREVLEQMSEKDQELFTLYYYKGLTLKSIGSRFGVSESRISQRMTQAHKRAYRLLQELA